MLYGVADYESKILALSELMLALRTRDEPESEHETIS